MRAHRTHTREEKGSEDNVKKEGLKNKRKKNMIKGQMILNPFESS